MVTYETAFQEVILFVGMGWLAFGFPRIRRPFL
jgi:hypothetical protein